MTARAAIVLALLACAVAVAAGANANLPDASYFQVDERVYLEMSRAPALSGLVRDAPFCWRPLLPELVRWTPLEPHVAFQVWMVAALTVLPVLVAAFLTATGASLRSAITGGVLMAVAPAVVGYFSWDHARVDTLALVLSVVAALCFVRERYLVFAAAVLALSLTKESWLVVALFALVWSTGSSPRARRWSVIALVLGVACTAAMRWRVPPSAPYSLIANFHARFVPFNMTVVLRRAMLAVGSTWNVLGPLAAYAIARRVRDPRALALAAATLVATSQVLVAIDTQRLVAAAYPFVLVACAWDLDRLQGRLWYVASVGLVMAQVPWLLVYARVTPMALRWADIGLSLAAVAAVVAGLVHSSTKARRIPSGATYVR